MLDIIDTMTAAFLSALQNGYATLSTFSLLILGICATISYYREYSTTVMATGVGTGDALAHALTLIFMAGCYIFVLQYLFPIAQAALATVFNWGLLGSGGDVTAAQLQQPSFILATGFKVAAPIADFDTWMRTVRSVFKLLDHPGDLIAYTLILASFIAITAHHMMMLIEYYLAVMLGAVLIPWGVWRASAGIGEFGLGWLTGALIRALISAALIGIANPTFQLLNVPVPGAGFLSYAQSFTLAGASFIYFVLCWIIPANAARMAGQASLGLTGSTIAAAAMTTARFGMMAVGGARGIASAAAAISRVTSPMLKRP